ncbi:conserved hypothetical protein [Gloeothece citriformis PCC 7424]|uniref:Trypsin-co-occurring domain-containing protein n=1 Tax=Gloeothece citriformis (strain PCC 7424) TaxID=65393 RepID=B7KID9_GLOC7|nr:CU044_2847 family protein [Gloeothece citriformis]ACK73626.1 conserved hypothetical protein [Gloeothece citriformis PCC 7424]
MNYDDEMISDFSEIIPVKVADGVTIMVEATSLGGDEDVGIGDFEFSDVTDAIEAIANSITTTFDKIKPKKASVEFGVEIGVESGKLTALLVKGSSKTNLKITLHWEN